MGRGDPGVWLSPWFLRLGPFPKRNRDRPKVRSSSPQSSFKPDPFKERGHPAHIQPTPKQVRDRSKVASRSPQSRFEIDPNPVRARPKVASRSPQGRFEPPQTPFETAPNPMRDRPKPHARSAKTPPNYPKTTLQSQRSWRLGGENLLPNPLISNVLKQFRIFCDLLLPIRQLSGRKTATVRRNRPSAKSHH